MDIFVKKSAKPWTGSKNGQLISISHYKSPCVLGADRGCDYTFNWGRGQTAAKRNLAGGKQSRQHWCNATLIPPTPYLHHCHPCHHAWSMVGTDTTSSCSVLMICNMSLPWRRPQINHSRRWWWWRGNNYNVSSFHYGSWHVLPVCRQLLNSFIVVSIVIPPPFRRTMMTVMCDR